MVSRDVAALFMEHMPDDEIRSLRDSIAKAEAELTAPMWERHRELHGRIEKLKGKCAEAAYSLTIVLARKVGTRRRGVVGTGGGVWGRGLIDVMYAVGFALEGTRMMIQDGKCQRLVDLFPSSMGSPLSCGQKFMTA